MGCDCKVYLETGSLFGGSLCLVMQDPTPCSFVGIDLFDGYYGKGQDPKTKKHVDIKTARQNIDKLNIHQHKYSLIQGSSYDEKTVDKFRSLDLMIDILLIDGDHSYQGVSKDYHCYKNFINSGGFAIFDNYGEPNVWEDVKRAVDEIDFESDGFQKIGQYGFSYFIRKK